MENRCKIDARKGDAKSMKNERKWSRNGSPNHEKIEKSAIENARRFWYPPGATLPDFWGTVIQALKKTFRQITCKKNKKYNKGGEGIDQRRTERLGGGTAEKVVC